MRAGAMAPSLTPGPRCPSAAEFAGRRGSPRAAARRRSSRRSGCRDRRQGAFPIVIQSSFAADVSRATLYSVLVTAVLFGLDRLEWLLVPFLESHIAPDSVVLWATLLATLGVAVLVRPALLGTSRRQSFAISLLATFAA